MKENTQKNANHNKSVTKVCYTHKKKEEVNSAILEHKIDDKLMVASQNKKQMDQENQSKRIVMNAKKQAKGMDAMKLKESNKIQLEEEMEQKMHKAKNKKDTIVAKKTFLLSKSIQDKMKRGANAIRKQEESSKALEANVDMKLVSALNRKDERLTNAVEEIVKKHNLRANKKETNEKKIQNATRKLEEAIDSKMKKVIQRKEQNDIQSAYIIANKSQKRLEKSRSAMKKLDVAKKKLDLSIKLKLKNVTERKKQLTYEQVDTIAKSTNNKLEKGEKAMKEKETKAAKLDNSISKKLNAAIARKEKKKAARKKDMILTSFTKKKRVNDMLNKQDDALRLQEQTINSKISSAAKRKTDLTNKTVQEIALENKKKEEKKVDVIQKAQEISKQIETNLEEKLNQAADRKEKLKSKAMERNFQNNGNSNTGKSGHSLLAFATTPSKQDLEKKLDKAAIRRESMLKQKSEKAAYFSNRMGKRSQLSKSTGDLLGISTPNYVACSPVLSTVTCNVGNEKSLENLKCDLGSQDKLDDHSSAENDQGNQPIFCCIQ